FALIDAIDEDEEEETARNSLALIETVSLVSIAARRRLEQGSKWKCNKRAKKRDVINYDRERARKVVMDDYLGPYPIFRDYQFERFFRITRSHFDILLTTCCHNDRFFLDAQDAAKKRSICPKVKILMALKCLAFGVSPSAFIDYFQMGYTTGRECIKHFCKVVSHDDNLRSLFFRQMNRADAIRISDLHEQHHGVRGMIGCLDCMHIGWKNCPVAWQGQFQGKDKIPTVVLEAVADYNLWFWHASFGYAGTLNDINIWEQSPLLTSLLDGTFSKFIDFEFELGGKVLNTLWFLVDGIYPEIARFAKTLEEAVGEDRKIYVRWQEGCRKSIERAFGVLQRKFQVLRKDVEEFYLSTMNDIVITCILLHNMMVSHRVENDQLESEDYYLFDDDEKINEEQPDIAEEIVERKDAELRMLLAMDNLYNTSSISNLAAEEEFTRQKWFSFYKEVSLLRWKQLYNPHKHYVLRECIINQLRMNRLVANDEE
ncbi:MAG: transposase, partial [Sediminibacterium sp.]|nr:transposase [Sediminibacterium sp.]